VIVNATSRPFEFYPFIDDTGAVIMAGSRVATQSDVDNFMRSPEVEPELDRLTLEMCAYERSQGIALEQWQIDAELVSFNRTRQKASQ